MLLLNTIKLILIALNILPYRITHRKILFMIYLGTLVCNGEFYCFLLNIYYIFLSLFKGSIKLVYILMSLLHAISASKNNIESPDVTCPCNLIFFVG